MTKKEQIVFMKGKEQGLKRLFSSENFGYLAIGRCEVEGDNGFENPLNDTDSNGFNEISRVNDDSTYARIPLQIVNDTVEDRESGKVRVKFTADLDINNIVNGLRINQLAIVDSQDCTDPNTVIYAASTFPTFTKSEKIAITFLIEMVI